jgi:hypothetical protein
MSCLVASQGDCGFRGVTPKRVAKLALLVLMMSKRTTLVAKQYIIRIDTASVSSRS